MAKMSTMAKANYTTIEAAVRYNGNGKFNNSPDNRRLGMRPMTMSKNIKETSCLLRGRVKLTNHLPQRRMVLAKLAWRPQTMIEVGESDAALLFKLIDTLDDDDDVQTVWGNYEVSDAVMEKLA